MITLDHPWVASFLASDGPYQVLVDWLMDENAAAADMALMYAGTPPHHADGIPREALLIWLELAVDPLQARQAAHVNLVQYGVPKIVADVAPWATDGPGARLRGPTEEDLESAQVRTMVSERLNGKPLRPEHGPYRHRLDRAFQRAERWRKRYILGMCWAAKCVIGNAPKITWQHDWLDGQYHAVKRVGKVRAVELVADERALTRLIEREEGGFSG